LDNRLQARFPKYFAGGGKRKLKSIVEEVEEADSYWNEFIYNICDGDIKNMREMKMMDVFEFFDYVQNKMKKKKKHG
jgi:hypothetical protein